MVIPDFEIKRVIDGIMMMLRHDLATVRVKESTIMYKLFGNKTYGRFVYVDQAMSVFSKVVTDPKYIKIKMAFDGDTSSTPVIYITDGGDEPVFSPIGLAGDSRSYESRFRGRTSVVIVSNSLEEAGVIYNVIRAMLIAVVDTFEEIGLQNIKIGGSDIRQEDELIPRTMFVKALSLSYEYDVDVPAIAGISEDGTNIRDIIFRGTAYDEIA